MKASHVVDKEGIAEFLKSDPDLLAVFEDAAQVMLDEARGLVPVDTGRLRDGLTVSVKRLKKGPSAQLKSRTPYTAPVEFGHTTNGHTTPAKPFMSPALYAGLKEVERHG